MTFHVPKGLQLIATGTKETDRTDGKITTTEWKTDVPLAVVGFSLGDFAMKEATVPGKLGDNLTVDAYANKQVPDVLSRINEQCPASRAVETTLKLGAVGKISTVSMLPVQLSQGEVALSNLHRLLWPTSLRENRAHAADCLQLRQSAGPCSSTCPSAASSTTHSGTFSCSEAAKICIGRSSLLTK